MSESKKHVYSAPPSPSHGYNFVMAGCLFRNYSGLTVYVKHTRRNDQKNIHIKDCGQHHIWFLCPDREIVIVRNGYETGAFYPSGDSFDEVWEFNPFNDAACQDMGIKYVMTNYAHTTEGEQHPRLRSTVPDKRRVTVLSDSGGLQLARGVTKSIHPAELSEFYNKNVDGGMVLDIPLYVKDRETLERAARLQRTNTNIMLDVSKGSELINIFHGTTAAERMRYREIVEDERINRVAMAALHKQSLITAVNDIYHTIHDGPKRYKQYHALGIYIATYIPLLVKMANSGESPAHITSDSTSHIQSASNRAYHFQFDMMQTSKRLPIGSRYTLPNAQKILPCQCAVCKALKYADILAFGPQRFSLELLSIHNAIEMTRYAEMMQNACRTLNPKEYNDLVVRQLTAHRDLKDVKGGLDFIDIAAQDGLLKARAKYERFLNVQRSAPVNTMQPLFLQQDTHSAEDAGLKHKKTIKVIKRMEAQVADYKFKVKPPKMKIKEKV